MPRKSKKKSQKDIIKRKIHPLRLTHGYDAVRRKR